MLPRPELRVTKWSLMHLLSPLEMELTLPSPHLLLRERVVRVEAKGRELRGRLESAWKESLVPPGRGTPPIDHHPCDLLLLYHPTDLPPLFLFPDLYL
jgi:hypothetical protein